MPFQQDKQNTLEKEDLSRKGSIDEHIRPICDIINSKQDYYTTSSCAGRIVLSIMPDSGKKKDFDWLLVSHEKVTADQINEKLNNLPNQEVWLMFEPFIFHTAARTIDHANKLLKLLHTAGVKRAGIISMAEEKIIIEAIGSERLDSIIAKDKELIVPESYLKILIETANSKSNKNLNTIKKIEQELKNL
ncbi:tRNA wybutosine-synthesizing 3 family protein [Nanoarchaeota archaeon]